MRTNAIGWIRYGQHHMGKKYNLIWGVGNLHFLYNLMLHGPSRNQVIFGKMRNFNPYQCSPFHKQKRYTRTTLPASLNFFFFGAVPALFFFFEAVPALLNLMVHNLRTKNLKIKH